MGEWTERSGARTGAAVSWKEHETSLQGGCGQAGSGWPRPGGQAVVQEDADAVGLSLLSGAHLTLVPKVVKLLADAGRADVLVIVGGIIPEADIPVLEEQGVAHVFTPGAP